MVAKGYLTKRLGNDAVKSGISRHESEILEHFERVVNTFCMEETVQQPLEADGEFETPLKDNVPDQRGAELSRRNRTDSLPLGFAAMQHQRVKC